MSEDELTFEERNHLWNLVIISFLVAVFSLMAWLFVFEQAQLPLTGWKIFIWVGVPCGIVIPTSCFLAYEVFYPKRIRKSGIFHLKRFLRRTLSMTAVILSFAAVISFSDVSFSTTLGSEAIFPGLFLDVFIFAVAAFLWLRHQKPRSSQW